MTILYRIICIIFGYGFGLIQTAYLYGKIKNIDIRDYGSGNSGTTNAMRVLGKKAGLITFIGDLGKAILCSVLILVLFQYGMGYSSDYVLLLRFYGGVGVVLGHNFPFYMNFKGGKGIAATSGVILSLGDYKLILIELAIFIGVTLITKYVSLGSLCIMAAFFIQVVIYNELGILGFKNNLHLTGEHRIEMYIIVLFIAALAWYKHRANIKRLLNGTENKIGSKKSKTSNDAQ